jgi:hypothetical protein
MPGAQSYSLVVRGGSVERLADLVEPMMIRAEGDQTVLTVTIADQSHLRGVLDRITDLGFQLLTLERLGPVPPPAAGGADA